MASKKNSICKIRCDENSNRESPSLFILRYPKLFIFLDKIENEASMFIVFGLDAGIINTF